MQITTDFPGGNIIVKQKSDSYVLLTPDERDSAAKWFYWAFCVSGAQGTTVKFCFEDGGTVGRFGPAVSQDFKNWKWGMNGENDSFVYSFSENESCVWFAHDIVYGETQLLAFEQRNLLKRRELCISSKGRNVPYYVKENGENAILLTARHHCCESTGSYVLEGTAETLLRNMPENCSLIIVPFVDYDGVIDGDQGKNRIPHDHNRDYFHESIYPEVCAVKHLAYEKRITYAIDFHSPLHMGGRSDHAYIVHKGGGEIEKLFCNCFSELTKNDVMPYESNWDMLPGEGWNKINNPPLTFAEYFNYHNAKMSFTLETPYFGLNDDGNSPEAMRNLGTALAKAMCKF